MLKRSESLFYSVGRVKEPHGLAGDLYIKLRSGRADWLDSIKELYLCADDKFESTMKFQILKAKAHKEGLLIKTQELQDRNSAEELKGYYMGVPISLLRTRDPKNFYLFEILGFDVFHENELLGKIIQFGSNGAQDLIIVNIKNKEVMIPLINEFIKVVDFDNEKLIMELPPGLIDVDSI